MTDEAPSHELNTLLNGVYVGRDRVTQADIHRAAVAADLPADLMTRIGAMPEGEYALDEAAEVLDRGQAT
ncbi:hypothetical protein SAMN05444365_10136 [Micromonospora pattaloongensis]|uniref:DUF2795 domain-containing protein n=1 Tax=Micromonospora pattaloongensis TaxID=405436 RepID=A0A1H3FJH9_9ACTN|nr:hypothetical protein SAMN05444365_10136 [Micromonospora pattaloongensis]